MFPVPSNLVERARSGVRQFASGFTPGQKAVTVAAILVAIVGGGVLMSVTGKPTYAPLYTNLQASDVASITSQLTSAKVPYQLTNGGTTIMVPLNDVNAERVSLAAAGLPATSTVGLSLLDKTGITTSNMTQQADYLQALQGELEQTIDSISGVASSQVNIALPANQNFSLTQDNPTGASVLVTMSQGASLSSGDVQAIVHLVASSIPNLNSADVTVADSNGDLLAGPGVTPGASGGGGQSNSYDSAVAAKVVDYLASVVGPGNADVQVNATLDYSKVSTTTNSIQLGPNGKPVSFCTQNQQSSQTYTGTGTPPGGTAGAITATTVAGSTGNYSNTTSNQTCETSEQTQTVQQAPGTLKSEQVAVLINSAAIPKGVNLKALQAGVAAAAGINTARGDQLAFSTMPFNTSAAQQAAAAAKAAAASGKSKSLEALIKTGIIFLIIALVLFMLWRSARKARMAPTVLGPGELEALRAAREYSPTALMPAYGSPELPVGAQTMAINEFVDHQPEDVANILRMWLADSPNKAVGR